MHRPPRLPRVPLVSASTLLAVALACGCGDNKSRPTQNSIAAAFENQVDPRAKARQAEEDMRRLKERAEAEAEAAVLAEIEKITTPAADAPTENKAACEALRAAQDAFVQKRLSGVELDKWNVMKPLDLDELVADCVAADQPKVAACQAHAFGAASLEIGRDRSENLMTTCTRKFGQPLAAAPGAKDKPAG